MTEIGRIDRDAAKFDPASRYTSPSELTGETMLTRGEKIATLLRWRDQLLAQMSAADDGMPTRRSSTTTVTQVQEIDAAIAALRHDPKVMGS